MWIAKCAQIIRGILIILNLLKKCARNHVKFLFWYDTYEPNRDNLNSGEFYIFGYDKQLRPVIIIKNITHDNLNDFLYLLETIKR